MTTQLRVALLGYGLAGRIFHAPARAGQARADLPHVTVLPDAQAVWDNPDDYDLVVVATANVAHREQTQAALRRGLHVVVDKPLAGDADTARALVALADQHDRQLHVFHNRRWDSDLRTLRFLLEEGRLGHLHRLESRFERWRPEPEGRWRESPDPAQLGGLLLDLGSHLVDQALLLLGPVETVYAELGRLRDPLGPEDDVFLALRHHSGSVSHLWAGALAGRPGPRFRALGTRGAYVVDALDSQEDQLKAGRRPGQPGWGEEPPERWGRLYPSGETVPTLPGAWQEFYQRVAACIQGHSPPPVEPTSVVETLRVLDAARESARLGQVVALEGEATARG